MLQVGEKVYILDKLLGIREYKIECISYYEMGGGKEEIAYYLGKRDARTEKVLRELIKEIREKEPRRWEGFIERTRMNIEPFFEKEDLLVNLDGTLQLYTRKDAVIKGAKEQMPSNFKVKYMRESV